MSEVCAIILAGGSGSRLWPLSRHYLPKHLLCLDGESSLLQKTAERLLKTVSPDKIYTVTPVDHQFEVAGQLHKLHPDMAENVFVEPMRRNTLPAIAWVTAAIAKKHPNAVVSVFPSDHSIGNVDAFQRAWQAAETVAATGKIALFGLTPDRPAVEYGYIECGEDVLTEDPLKTYAVERFVEKPDLDTAKGYVDSGKFCWNGGMFVYQSKLFMDLLNEHQPEIHQGLNGIMATQEAEAAAYEKFPNVSIDYGLMEKTDKIGVVPVEMSWTDLGSFEALHQELPQDQDENVLHGDVIPVDSSGNFIWSDGGLVTTLGVKDLVIVQTADATLVCQKSQSGRLKEVFTRVENFKKELTEVHSKVFRPWGSYTVLHDGADFKIKIIEVTPGARLSLQSHEHRNEHWTVVDGSAVVELDGDESTLERNQSIYIPATSKHRLSNRTEKSVKIIEVQVGTYLGEDDIVRYEDDFGRV